MATITRVARVVAGIVRNIDLAASGNILHVDQLDVGASSPASLTKTILTNLIALQNGSDFADGTSSHTHDGRYFTETELGSSGGSSGSDLIGDDATYANFTPAAATVKGALTGINTALGARVLKGGDTMTGFLTLNADPTSALHAATKQYVDNLLNGLDWKQSVRAASTVNVNLSNAVENGDALDGVTLVTGNRILLKNQATAAENGIYIVQATGAAVRAADANSWDELVSAACFVEEGTANADKGYVCTSDSGGALETDPLDWVQFTSAGSFVAGNGITISSNTISVNHDGDGLTFNGVQLSLELDGSTLSKSASGLKVADLGIDTAQLAADSVTKTKLNADVAGLGMAQATGGELDVRGVYLALTNANAGTLAAGTVVRISANGSFDAADADALATAGGVIGVLLASTLTTATGQVQIAGRATPLGGGAYTAGSRVYLSGTAGSTTLTAPSAASSCIVLVGTAVSATEIVIGCQFIAENE